MMVTGMCPSLCSEVTGINHNFLLTLNHKKSFYCEVPNRSNKVNRAISRVDNTVSFGTPVWRSSPGNHLLAFFNDKAGVLSFLSS